MQPSNVTTVYKCVGSENELVFLSKDHEEACLFRDLAEEMVDGEHTYYWWCRDGEIG